MNEQIKLLATQSGLVRVGDFGMKRWEGPRSDSINDQDLEKFAELIVQECIDYCGENLSKTVGGALKIHFGVKE